MRHSFFFFFFTSLLILLFQAAVGDIVEDTCKNVKMDYNFCVKALGADAKSHTADLQGLGIISVKLIIGNASKIISVRIEKLLADKTGGPDARPLLLDCKDFYTYAISYAQNAIADFKSKDYASVNVEMVKAVDESSDCRNGFHGIGLEFPLENEAIDFVQLTRISRGIAELLQRSV